MKQVLFFMIYTISSWISTVFGLKCGNIRPPTIVSHTRLVSPMRDAHLSNERRLQTRDVSGMRGGPLPGYPSLKLANTIGPIRETGPMTSPPEIRREVPACKRMQSVINSVIRIDGFRQLCHRRFDESIRVVEFFGVKSVML